MSSRGKLLQLKVSDEEKALLEKAAERETLKLAQWVRQVVIKEARRLLGMV